MQNKEICQNLLEDLRKQQKAIAEELKVLPKGSLQHIKNAKGNWNYILYDNRKGKRSRTGISRRKDIIAKLCRKNIYQNKRNFLTIIFVYLSTLSQNMKIAQQDTFCL